METASVHELTSDTRWTGRLSEESGGQSEVGTVIAVRQDMRPAPAAHRNATNVTIVSDNAETLDGLEPYLQRAGVATRSTRNIARAVELTATFSAAVVIFPDDFGPAEVADARTNLGAQRANTLIVLVTCAPKQFARAQPLGATTLTVPRPAWGWTILDAIREHWAGQQTP